jgi:catechol 2,3-dioxygenase-like lactoylglutathione lyase family enzyme
MKINTDGIHHISLRVNDLGRAREFYGNALGFDLKELGEALNLRPP